MFKKILVPVDGSSTALYVLKKAEEMAREYDSTLYVLTVIPEPILLEQAPTDIPTMEIIKARKSRSKYILEEAQKSSGYTGQVQFVERTGSVPKEIVAFAEEEDVDLIVIGNRGLGAFSRTLLGSVSNRVINLTKKPVLVFKEDHE